MLPSQTAQPTTATISLGPYYPGLPQGLQVKLELNGGRPDMLGWIPVIAEAQAERGYGYVGLEERVARSAPGGVEWEQALQLVEGLCGPCSQANTLAYVQAVEAMAELPVPPRALYLRLALVEIERIASHLMNAADTLSFLGLPEREVALRDLRERLVQAAAELSGTRIQHGLITYGGLARNIGDKPCMGLTLETRHVERTLRSHVTSIVKSREIAARLALLGVVSTEEAIEAGLRGPTARAAGVTNDLRASLPTGAYEEVAVTTVMQRAGDAFARLTVRLLECLDSIRLIEEALDDLPHGPVKTKWQPEMLSGSGVSRVEGPRGEIFCWVKGTAHGLTGLHLSAGSFPTLGVLPGLLRGQRLEDLPLLLASLDLCLPCAER